MLSAAAGARARRRGRRGGSARQAEAGQPGGDACIDENVKADLFAKRKQRTTRDRLFQQTNRHELTVRRAATTSSDTFDGVVYAQQAKIGSVPLYTFGSSRSRTRTT